MLRIALITGPDPYKIKTNITIDSNIDCGIDDKYRTASEKQTKPRLRGRSLRFTAESLPTLNGPTGRRPVQNGFKTYKYF